MRIHVLSDLHLNTGAHQVPTDLDADVMVVAGDVMDGTAGVEWLCEIGHRAIFVPGNHEYYSHSADVDMETIERTLRDATLGTNVTFLQNDQAIIDNVRFLGTALWTDFGQLDPVLLELASGIMTDYRLIHVTGENMSAEQKEEIGGDAANVKFSPLAAYALHARSVKWLSERLNEPFDGKTVVVTHHHPSYQSLRIAGIDQELLDRANWKQPSDREVALQLNRVAAYASDLDDFLERYQDAIDLWICGHLHTKLDYVHHGVHIVCNPRGYGARASMPSNKSHAREAFDPRFVVTLNENQ